jgi:hypothetical protein
MKHTHILPATLRSAMKAGLLIVLLGAAAVGLPSLHGATITVTSTNDNGVIARRDRFRTRGGHDQLRRLCDRHYHPNERGSAGE